MFGVWCVWNRVFVQDSVCAAGLANIVKQIKTAGAPVPSANAACNRGMYTADELNEVFNGVKPTKAAVHSFGCHIWLASVYVFSVPCHWLWWCGVWFFFWRELTGFTVVSFSFGRWGGANDILVFFWQANNVLHTSNFGCLAIMYFLIVTDSDSVLVAEEGVNIFWTYLVLEKTWNFWLVSVSQLL